MSTTKSANGQWASLSVRTKIVSAVVIAAIATVATGAIGLSEVRTVADNGRTVYSRGLVPTREVGTIRELVWTARWAGTSLTFATDQKSVTTYTTAWNTTIAKLDSAVATYTGYPLSAAQKASITSFGTNWKAYLTARDKGNALKAAGDLAGYAATKLNEISPAIARAMSNLDSLSAESDNLATSQLKGNDNALKRAETLVVIAIVLGAGLALALALLVARSITGPLNRVKDVLTAVAAGDLTGDVEIQSSNEIGQMARSLTQATVRMRQAVKTIGLSSAALDQRANELQDASTTLSDSAAQTAHRAGGISSTVNEVSSGVQAVATGAEEMGASIREISINAQHAAQVAGNAVNIASETQEIMVGLGVSSAEIDDVIKLITSIAAQTNLLALNATIEAARAGEAGRGFAVVAGEVKDLAQETAKATDNISRSVAAIQNDARRAVESIAGVTQVIGEIDDFQTTIASAVEEQSATTQGMASDLSVAAGGVSQIGAGMSDVTAAAESTLLTARTTSDAAHELASLSKNLKDAVLIFRV